MKKINHKVYYRILAIAAPVLLIVIWYLASSNNLVNANILPSPIKVFNAFISLVKTGKLQKDLTVSLIRVLKGFAIGTIIGVILGTIMGLSKGAYAFLSALVSIFRPIPMIAWIPMLILWLGIGESSKVAVIFIGSLWPVLLNTISGIHSVDPKLLEVAQILDKGKLTVFIKVILPSAWPSIFTGIRLSISTAWVCVVAAEMVAASSGVGYLITYARELSQPDVVLTGVFTIGIVGFLIDFIILQIQKSVLKWDSKYLRK